MKGKKVVEWGDRIAIRYLGKFISGRVFDRSHKKRPLVYRVGSGKVMEAFDRAVVGMAVGERKSFRLLKEEAYGEVRGELLIEVPMEHLPKGITPRVGMLLDVPVHSLKRPYPFTVTRVGDLSISLNANHPLAGRDLLYDVILIAILPRKTIGHAL